MVSRVTLFAIGIGSLKRAYTREQVSQFIALSPFGRHQMTENAISMELPVQMTIESASLSR